jgi:hypothetical protein
VYQHKLSEFFFPSVPVLCIWISLNMSGICFKSGTSFRLAYFYFKWLVVVVVVVVAMTYSYYWFLFLVFVQWWSSD